MKKRLSFVLAFLYFTALGMCQVGEYTNYSSAAAEASAVVKATPGRLFQLVGYNASASDQFIQIHNTASLPANGVVPYRSFKAIAGKNFVLEIPAPGLALSTGITVCNSSTSATKTIGSADCLFYATFQ